MTGSEMNASKSVERLKLELKGFVERRYGAELTQENLSAVLNITRGAVANLPESEMPRTKVGDARTDRVYYMVDDVVNYLVNRIVSKKLTKEGANV